MESSSSSTPSNFLSYWTYLNLLLFRPVLAILFVLSFIFLWWWLAWKLVLVHVPLVQEIFGLRKKPVNRKPPTRRLSKYYNSINAHNSTSHFVQNSDDSSHKALFSNDGTEIDASGFTMQQRQLIGARDWNLVSFMLSRTVKESQ